MSHLKHQQLLLIFILSLIQLATSARILGVFIFPSRSHGILGSELLKGLAKRGHQVTMLSPYPLDTPHENYTDLVISLNKTRPAYEKSINNKDGWDRIVILYKAMSKVSELVYEEDTVLKLINSSQKFDIIIYHHLTHYSLLGLSHKFNATSVLFNFFGANQFLAYTMNLPLPSSYVPHFFGSYGEKMTFWERAHNLYLHTMSHFHLAFVAEPQERMLLKKYFPAAPSLDTLVENIQLVLLNSDIAFESIRPTFQNMINIGGYYIGEGEPLPNSLEQFLDNSQNGVIYISFGSNIRAGHLTPETINKFLDTFRQLPFNILWKLDVDLPQKPPNVMILNWIPQTSVLAHKNVKLFVSHGGRGGINEAIYFGVPMLLFPFYSDQHMNALQCVKGEIALRLDFANFSKEDFLRAIEQLIYTKKYKENMMQRSDLIRNRLVHPMDVANYWIEYLAKYGNSSSVLKSEATGMPWYKLLMVDVLAVLCLFILFVTCFIYFIIRKISSLLKSSSVGNFKSKTN